MKKVAILTTNGFEEVELTSPMKFLKEKGYEVHVVAPIDKAAKEANKVRAWQHTDWGSYYDIDVHLQAAKAEDYAALILPGGTINPDKLRVDNAALDFIDSFMKKDKIVAAICHGPWPLVERHHLKGRQVTSVKNVATDLKNAGAHWEDKSVVIDKNLITSRTPEDLSDFNHAIAAALSKI